jgi:DNA-binding Xre family transcriptional regulator
MNSLYSLGDDASTIGKLCNALGCRPRDLLLPSADDSA